MLKYQVFGKRNTLFPLILVHGLFGSGRNFGSLAKRLSDRRQVVTPDLRNHGESFWADEHTYEALAADLASVIKEIGAPCDVMGHSMGGKTAMVLALSEPNLVNRLIVSDIAPVTYTHSQMDQIDAMRAVDLSNITKRSDAQLETDDPAICAFLLQNLDVANRKWRINLDVLAEDMDHILGFPDLNARFEGPTLFLSGGKSDYMQPEYRAECLKLFPNARFAKFKDAGHWLHADEPAKFEATLRQVFA